MKPREFLRLLRSPLWRPTPEREVHDDLQFHLEMRMRDYRREGMSEEQARRAALEKFGDQEAVFEQCVDFAERRNRFDSVRHAAHMLWTDAVFALRYLRRRPGFTAVAAGTLALGVAANVVILSIVNDVLVEPLPYQDPEEVVQVMATFEGRPGGTISYADGIDLRDQARTLESLALYQRGAMLLRDERPTQIGSARVSVDFFDVLGVRPAAGRFFGVAESEPGHADVVVVSWDLWQSRFGGDPDLIGSKLTLNDRPYTVLGVAPRDFVDPRGAPQLWEPEPTFWTQGPWTRGTRILTAYGRLAEGATLEDAQSELDVLAGNLETAHPETNTGMGVLVRPLQDILVSGSRGSLVLLAWAAAILLMIGCANLTNLLLSRGTGRRQELAVRRGLGASRRRLVTQLLIESSVLALIGGAVGLALAVVAHGALVRLAGPNLARAAEVQLDGTALLVALAVSLAAALLFGIAPALQLSRARAEQTLRAAGRSSTMRSSRLRSGIVVAEIAAALVLLVGAGLLIKSFWILEGVDDGIDAERLVTLRLAPPQLDYPEADDITRLYQELVTHLEAVPGVTGVAGGNILPLTRDNWSNGFLRDDLPRPEPGQTPLAQAHTVTPGYFDVLGLRLVAGRSFDAGDLPDREQVAIVDEVLAERYFPGEDPIGKQITSNGPSRRIVGVVQGVRQYGVAQEEVPVLYTPHAQQTAAWMRRDLHLFVRTDGAPERLAGAVRRAIWEFDGALPIIRLRTMDEIARADVAAPRFRTTLIGLIAAVALSLAALGIASVIAFDVSQRIPEIALRAALGADRGSIFGLVLGRGTWLTLLGLAIGLLASVGAVRLLDGMLFGVPALDPGVMLVASLFLAAMALGAGYLPTRRALRISPATALTRE